MALPLRARSALGRPAPLLAGEQYIHIESATASFNNLRIKTLETVVVVAAYRHRSKRTLETKFRRETNFRLFQDNREIDLSRDHGIRRHMYPKTKKKQGRSARRKSKYGRRFQSESDFFPQLQFQFVHQRRYS